MTEITKAGARPFELTELLTFLLEVSEQVNSTLDLDELMVRIAAMVQRVIDYDIFAILLLNERTQEMRIRYSVGHPEEVVRRLRVKVGEGIVGRAAQLRRSVLVNDVRQDPDYIQSLPSVQSELAVPLIMKNRVIGVMDLEAPHRNFFTPQHQNLLEVIAGRTAMAIENARLYRRSVRQARTLQLLNEISREMSSVLVLNDLLSKIGALVKRLIDYTAFSILLANEQTQTLEVVIALRQGQVTASKMSLPYGQGLVGAAAKSRQILSVGNVDQDPRYIRVNKETRSELVVPLIYRDRVLGVVDLESTQTNFFTEEHVRIFSTLAPQIAIAIANAQLYERVARSEARLERDLESARVIQGHLMPTLTPRIRGLEVAVRYQPARELGGDLFDFQAYGKDRHVLALGDVSGKGAPAALYGAMASGILRSLAPIRLTPGEVLRRLNLTLLERKIEAHFITLLYAVWEPKTKMLRLANAGMPLPLLVRNGSCRRIRAEGVPLGLLDGMAYQETEVNLQKGDLLALCSDGVLEAADPQFEEFGSRRLDALLREHAGMPVGDIIEKIYAELARHEQGRPRRDDQTMIMVRVR